MNNTDEYYTVNDRQYLNPNVPLQESEGFIQKLRDTQTADTQRINTETHNLGTNVPSNLGGLGGSESIWKGRYQDPQTNKMISDLKSVAQAQALETTMNNLFAQKQQQYKNLYKQKAKEYSDKLTSGGKTGGGGGTVETGEPTPLGDFRTATPGVAENGTAVSDGQFVYITDNDTGYKYQYELNPDGTSTLYSTTDPSQKKDSKLGREDHGVNFDRFFDPMAKSLQAAGNAIGSFFGQGNNNGGW